MIRQSVVNDLPVGRSVDEALRTLKAFQFFEKHGEGSAKSEFFKSSSLIAQI